MFDNLNRESSSGFDQQSTVWMLVSWPPLSSLFAQKNAPNIIRICALLARRPSAGKLIPVVLDIPSSVIYPLLTFLYIGGYICPIGENSLLDKKENFYANFHSHEKAIDELDEINELQGKNSFSNLNSTVKEKDSFLEKTWSKLVDKWHHP